MRRSSSSSMVAGRGRASSGLARAASSKSARQWEGGATMPPGSLSNCRFDHSSFSSSTPVSFSALQRPLLAATIHFLQQLIEVEEDLTPSLQRNEMTRRFYECHYYENKSSGRIRYLVDSINDCSPLTVCTFLLQILHQGIFGVAELIISIMYLLEFQKRTQVSIHTLTWRPLLVTSLLLADKMWEDKPMRLTDMTKLFPVLNSSELKQLESDLVGRLQFNIVVKPEEFAEFCERLCSEEVHPDIVRAVGDSEYWVSLQDSRGRGPRTLHSDHIAILMSKSSRLALLNQPMRKASLSQRGRRLSSQHSVGSLHQAMEGCLNADSPRKSAINGTQSARPASARRNGSLGSLRPQPRQGGGSASSTTQGSEGNAGSFSSVLSSTSSAPPPQGGGSSAHCSPRRKSSLCSSPGNDGQTAGVVPPPSWFQRTHSASVSTTATATTTPNINGSGSSNNGLSSGSNSNSSSNCNPSPSSQPGSGSRIVDQRPRTPRTRGSATSSTTPRNVPEGRSSTPRGYPQSQHMSTTPRACVTSTTPRGSRGQPTTPRRIGSSVQALSSPRKTPPSATKVEAPGPSSNPEAREARAMALLTSPRGYPQPMPTPPTTATIPQRLEAGAVLRRRTPPPQASGRGVNSYSRNPSSPSRQNNSFFNSSYNNSSSNNSNSNPNSCSNSGGYQIEGSSGSTPRGAANANSNGSSHGNTTFLINFNTAGMAAPGGGVAVPVSTTRPAPQSYATGAPNGVDQGAKFDTFPYPQVAGTSSTIGASVRRRAGSLGSITGSGGGAASGPIARRSRGSTPTRPAVQGQASRLSLATQALRRQGSMSSMLVGGSSVQSMAASARARSRGGSCAAADRARWAI